MFHQYCVAFLLTLILIAIQGRIIIESEGCSDVTDCECGEQCVDVTDILTISDPRDLRLCNSSSCECLAGCAVGDIFILPGVNRPRTYCNLCGCPSEQSHGIPWCTRAGWCNLPENGTIYHVNPACFVQHQNISKFEE